MFLILDLDATENPHWSNTTNWNGKEFGGTSWVFCMLDNYGGRTGMHGELEYLATQITKANQESDHMKGIGITPEGTLLNPVNYDLFWEMVWETEPKDTKAWLKDYITRRYGEFSENSGELGRFYYQRLMEQIMMMVVLNIIQEMLIALLICDHHLIQR